MTSDEAAKEIARLNDEIHALTQQKREVAGKCEHDKTRGEYDAWDRVTIPVCCGCGAYVNPHVRSPI